MKNCFLENDCHHPQDKTEVRTLFVSGRENFSQLLGSL